MMGLIGSLPQGLPAVSHVLSSPFQETRQIGHTGAIFIALQTQRDFGL